MRNLNNIDIRHINKKGRYINLNVPLMFDLTDEEIIYLRKLYNNPNIASERIIKSYVKPKYKLDKSSKYNRGKHQVKRKIENKIGKKLIIGSLVVTIGLSCLYYMDKSSGMEIYAGYNNASSYQQSTELAEYDIDALRDLNDISKNALHSTIDQERKDLIKNICDIYQVNYDVVYEKLVQLTDNFTSDSYLNGYIDGVTCKGEAVSANSEEELLVYTIRCMKQLPENLGMSSINLNVNTGYKSDDNYFGQIDRVANVLGINRCLMYAIVQSECGFNSEMFNSINNPAGLKNSYGDWWSFSTKEEGFFELGMEILKYYRMIGKDPSQIDYDTLSEIRDIHAPLSDGNDYWLPNVVDCLSYAQMNETTLFSTQEENNRLSY